MAPKKKFRNNKAKKSHEETPRPPTKIPCQKCGKEIIVPKTCKHGKKLLNCQGTGCTTAHIEEHNAHCTPVSVPSIPKRPQARTELADEEKATMANLPENLAMRWDDGSRMADSELNIIPSHLVMQENDRRAEIRAEILAKMTPERLHAMGVLTVQLNAAIKFRGGKPVRYLDGVPFTEWFAKMEKGPIAFVDEWIEKLKDIVERKKTVEEVGYDDEESEGDGDDCATPEDENEEDEPAAKQDEGLGNERSLKMNRAAVEASMDRVWEQFVASAPNP